MTAVGAALASSKGLSSNALDPSTVPGMVAAFQTDNVVLNGGGFAIELASLVDGALWDKAAGTDTNRFQGNTTEFPGHTVLYRAGGGAARWLTRTDAAITANLNGLRDYSFGAFCRGTSAAFPGTIRHLRVSGGSNAINYIAGGTGLSTDGMGLGLQGTGTSGGAVAGTSSPFTVAYTRDTSWTLVTSVYDQTTVTVEAFTNGVSRGTSAAATKREIVSTNQIVLGDASLGSAAMDGYFGGWFLANVKLTAAQLVGIYNWYVQSFA